MINKKVYGVKVMRENSKLENMKWNSSMYHYRNFGDNPEGVGLYDVCNLSIVEYHKEVFDESISYCDVEQNSDTYYWVEYEVGRCRDKIIWYLNQNWGVSFDFDKWLKEVHHKMFSGWGNKDDDFTPENLIGMFPDQYDWEHFWDSTRVLSKTVMHSLWKDLVDTWEIENEDEIWG